MSSHDTLGGERPQASAGHALIIAQTSELLVQACGRGSGSSPDQCSQIEQNGPTPRGRGRTPRVCWTRLWSSLLLCALQGMHSFADWRRRLGLAGNRPVCACLAHTHWPGQTTSAGGPGSLVKNCGSQSLRGWPTPIPGQRQQSWLPLEGDIFCLDETRLDALGRYSLALARLEHTGAGLHSFQTGGPL